MGYDLTNAGREYFHFNISSYGPMLAMARKYGWKSKGTIYIKDLREEIQDSGDINLPESESDWDSYDQKINSYLNSNKELHVNFDINSLHLPGYIDSIKDAPNVYYRDNWNGAYHGNDWQIVMADDANNIADALVKAIDFLPKIDTSPLMITYGNIYPGLYTHERLNRYRKEGFLPKDIEDKDVVIMTATEWLKDTSRKVHFLHCIDETEDYFVSSHRYEHPEIYSGGERIHFVQNFIKFCRGGAFYTG